ncbi:hypothetical protein [Aquimarina longa]|uniref:hypothetical protein n=1 Tax=Aquimarina longa TaxID=1080221 RepID=UPI0007855A7A|nr:hypothetical protein [Aquimarina longa]
MHRRKFIETTIIASTGVLLTTIGLSCSSDPIIVEELIGKSEAMLDTYPKEGDNYFAYYKLPQSDFRHTTFLGEDLFVFCKQGKIVGYTIKSKGIDNVTKYNTTLQDLYGTNTKVYENDFGEEYTWKTSDRQITLNHTKDYPNIPQNTFFSEAILDHKLLVF